MLDFTGHVMTLQIQCLNLDMEDYMDIFSIYNTIYTWNVVECDEAKNICVFYMVRRPTLIFCPDTIFYGIFNRKLFKYHIFAFQCSF